MSIQSINQAGRPTHKKISYPVRNFKPLFTSTWVCILHVGSPFISLSCPIHRNTGEKVPDPFLMCFTESHCAAAPCGKKHCMGADKWVCH